MQLILASNSPRRRELLGEWNIPFTAVPSAFVERTEGLSARATVAAFARGKADEVFSRYPAACVLGADTVVVLDGEILGKPKNAAHAREMLARLSGRTHSVLTGVCLLAPGVRREEIAETKVTFRPLSKTLIDEYVAGGSPLDKAGAYGIQDGYPLVERYEGSYTNVVGLPMELVYTLLKEVRIC